jgi:hypothetical protein
MGSGITVAELDAARPDVFAAAAQDWSQRVAAVFGEQVVTFNRYALLPLTQGTWSGVAADAAARKLSRVQADLSAAAEYMVGFAALLQAAADGIGQAQATLKAARNLAGQNALIIEDSGAVIVDAAAIGNRVMISEARASSATAVLEVQGLVSAALADAERAVSTLVPRLRNPEQFGISAAAGNWQADAASELAQAKVQGRTLQQAAIPARGTDPVEVTAWWQAQSSAEQVASVREFPALIGRLDGIPAYVRDKANRLLLAGDISADQTEAASLIAQQRQLEAKINDLTAHLPPGAVNARFHSPQDEQTVAALLQARAQLAEVDQHLSGITSQLGALQGLEGKLAEGGKPTVFNGRPVTMPQMYLMGFDTNSIGHALVACGNPDTAKNLCVYVPGLNTSMLSTHFEYDIQHAQNMTLQANSDTGTDSNATLLWLGYDAPQANGLGILKVAGTANAAAAVPDLTNCLKGLRSVDAQINNLTLVGHSYGSLVVGETAKQSVLPVDNIVLLGSPGISVDHASQLGIPAGHVWSGEAASDPVGKLGYFGIPPTDQTFGANPIQVGATGVLMQAHGEYFDAPGNINHDLNYSSLDNVASIMTGQYDNVTTAPYTHYGRPLSDTRPDPPPAVQLPFWLPVP